MPYVPTLWEDSPSTDTPITAARLNNMEAGIDSAVERVQDVRWYGAVGDGVTNDTTAVQDAITAAAAEDGLVYVPPGIYDTTLNSASDLAARIAGPGQVRDSANNLRAPWFSALYAAPSSYGDWGSVLTAFNGDLSKTQITMEHRIQGAATLRQPTSGYLNNPEASPVNIFLYNESGWNQETASNDGRTGAHAINVAAYNAGQGDAACITARGVVTGTRAGSTSVLANPAASILNGGVYAGADGVYLNPYEVNLEDQGNDAAAVGFVFNLDRTDATGAKDAFWNGIRFQSTGTEPVDVGLMCYDGGGGFRVGLDLANAGLETTGTWISAAITMSAGQRIYLNATGADAGSTVYRRPSATGTTYITYDTGITGINVVVGGTSALQLGGSAAVFPTQVYFASIVNFLDAQNIAFDTTTGTKIGTATTQKIGFWNATPVVRPTGWGAPTGTPTRTTFATGSVTLPQLAERVKALIDDLTTEGLIGA